MSAARRDSQPRPRMRRCAASAAFVAALMLTAGCAAPGAAEREAAQRARLAQQGFAVVVDACLYRQNPPLVSNAFLRRESLAAAAAIGQNLLRQLDARALRHGSVSIPFLCGSLAEDAPVKPNVAEALGAPAKVATVFPVPLAEASTPAAVLDAQRALFVMTSEQLREPRPLSPRRELSPAQRATLRQALGSSQVLVVIARGASISSALATTDVVLGLLLGGGGCRLGEGDCELQSTTHEGMRADALWLDLEDGSAPRLAKPVDIGERRGLLADLDPLLMPPYAESAWVERLLGSLGLPLAPGKAR